MSFSHLRIQPSIRHVAMVMKRLIKEELNELKTPEYLKQVEYNVPLLGNNNIVIRVNNKDLAIPVILENFIKGKLKIKLNKEEVDFTSYGGPGIVIDKDALLKSERVQYYIHILLKREVKIMDQQMKQLIQKSGDYDTRTLTVDEKCEVAAFLNVFFAPLRQETWRVKQEKQIIYDGHRIGRFSVKNRFSSAGTPRLDPESGLNFTKGEATGEAFYRQDYPLSYEAVTLGFTLDVLNQIRITIKEHEASSIYRGHSYAITDEQCVKLILTIIRKLEAAENLFIDASQEQTDINNQVRFLIAKHIYRERAEEIYNALPLKYSRSVAHIIASYAFFNPCLVDEEVQQTNTEAPQISSPGTARR